MSTKKRVTVLKEMLKFSGIDEARLKASWVSSAEAPRFAEKVTEFTDKVRKLGPNPLRMKKSA